VNLLLYVWKVICNYNYINNVNKTEKYKTKNITQSEQFQN